MEVRLFDFQQKALEETKGMNRVAYYYDMGLGKTFIGSEKAVSFGQQILVVCQKSKIKDWVEHFENYYSHHPHWLVVSSLTNEGCRRSFLEGHIKVGIINYDSVWRRTELAKLKNFTLLLDESSMIQNETSKRSKFILWKLKPDNVILLSGTPVGGKYENLWSQLRLLGWNISKAEYWNRFINYYIDDRQGFPLKVVYGYKNVDCLKEKMHDLGCLFKKSSEVLTLPQQTFIPIKVPTSVQYRKFRKNRIVEIDDRELVGDTTLTKLLYERQLCGMYSKDKLKALEDLLLSTEDRVVIFYSFTDELHEIEHICNGLNKPVSVINGEKKDLDNYRLKGDSVTIVQYQAGAMGLNLQMANRVIYFTPPLSSELFEQSKKRIHRIGQKHSCFYYKLICELSVEERIYDTLDMRKDFTDRLFEKEG